MSTRRICECTTRTRSVIGSRLLAACISPKDQHRSHRIAHRLCTIRIVDPGLKVLPAESGWNRSDASETCLSASVMKKSDKEDTL